MPLICPTLISLAGTRRLGSQRRAQWRLFLFCQSRSKPLSLRNSNYFGLLQSSGLHSKHLPNQLCSLVLAPPFVAFGAVPTWILPCIPAHRKIAFNSANLSGCSVRIEWCLLRSLYTFGKPLCAWSCSIEGPADFALPLFYSSFVWPPCPKPLISGSS